ncbi:MAG: NAD(P)-dependent oxidoreductase [Alphaproteobacteria bacterium]|jgi:4-hydroxybutyrate dehydrogenase/sulfolactaldehyde 3-reductase|nr:NAD(P)-dependent oxidoreductase [Alphaproteobacteria bacterium]
MSEPAVEPVGFIGLGAMGRPMALNLHNKGADLVVHDIDPKCVAALGELGAEIASSPAALAKKAAVVFTMLPDLPDVEDVLFGEDGVLGAKRNDLLVVNCSTMSPIKSRELGERLADVGVRYLEAPVTRGTSGAIAGTLCFLVGGAADDLEEVRSSLEAMGTTIYHCGAAGDGMAMKIVNNANTLVHCAALTETIAMGRKWGLNDDMMRELLTEGSADCYAVRMKLPKLIEGDFAPGFTIDLAHKDLGVALEFAAGLGTTLPVVESARGRMAEGRARDKGGRDTMALVELYED